MSAPCSERVKTARPEGAHPPWLRVAAGLLAMVAVQLAQAAAYTFPGALPAGCSGSGSSYTCGALTLAAADTVAVTNASTTITFTSLNNSSAKFNLAGTANLTLSMTGTLTVASGAVIKANVTAGSVSSSGAVTYEGSLTTTGAGAISLGAGTTVSGALTTVTGAITLLTGTSGNYTTVGSVNSGGTVTINSYNRINGDTVGYLLSAAGNNVFGGSITTTTTYVSLGGNATVNGSIYSQTYVDTGSNSNITGSITSATSYIDTGTATTVGGSLNALGTYVDIHGSATIGGGIKAQSYVSMTTNSTVGGNITANSTIAMGAGSTAAMCVRSSTAAAITVPSAGSVGGACCGTGSTCTSTCVSGSPKPATCSWPSSGVFAEYRFEQSSYSGTHGEALDSSGNKRHGKMVGSVTSTASGKFCRGITIPNNITSAIAAFDTGIDVNALGNEGTIAFWMKLVRANNDQRMLFDATTTAGHDFYLTRDDEGAGDVDTDFTVTNSGGTIVSMEENDATDDEVWVHVAATWKYPSSTHKELNVYINGALADTGDYTGTALSSTLGTLYFGDNRSAASDFLESTYGTIDQIKLYEAALTAGEVAAVYAESPSCAAPAPHHIEVTTSSSSGVTCNPVTYTIKACANADCSSTYTSGLTGNLVLTGTPTVNYTAAFTIPASSSSTTVQAHITTAGTITAGLSGLSATPSNTPQVFCGMGAAAASGGGCVYTALDSALLFDVSNHVSEVLQSSVTVSAIRSSDNATVCTPAFASVSKNVTFKCTYSNPTSGTKAVRVGGSALNASNNASAACDGTGRAVSLSFNASGVATTTVQYADVGQMGMTARYDGSGSDAGLVMQGSDTFIAAPASFAISGVTAGNIIAGSNFGATVTARNNAGNTAINFGNESSPATATLAFTKYRPIGVDAQAGSFSGSLGSFSSGVSSSSTLRWSEVGSGDLTVSLTGASYLGTGMTATGTTGSTGAVGPFVPNHFTVETANGCSSFTYSGQPFGVKVTARNASGGITQNYDGTANTSPNFGKAVTLSAATNGGTGSMGSATLAASLFDGGVADLLLVPTPTFTFTSKQTSPTSITVRATDTDGVNSNGYSEGSVAVRGGRLKLSNAFGTDESTLGLQVQAQYWSGKAWILSSGDSCTSVAANAVALSNYTNHQGAAGSWTTTPSAITISNGIGTLSLSTPSPAGSTGTVDVALNLGSTAADNACRGTHPATTGSNLSWLRSKNGNCAATFDRDPSARATFGVYSPETQRTIHVRPVY